MENLRISTMTALSKLSADIELNKLFDNLEINDIVKFVECKDKHKGYSKKMDKKKRKKINSRFVARYINLLLSYSRLRLKVAWPPGEHPYVTPYIFFERSPLPLCYRLTASPN